MFDIDFVMVDLAYGVENEGPIDSPAYRYAERNGAKGLPFFLVYEGKTLIGTIPYGLKDDLDSVVSEAQRLR